MWFRENGELHFNKSIEKMIEQDIKERHDNCYCGKEKLIQKEMCPQCESEFEKLKKYIYKVESGELAETDYIFTITDQYTTLSPLTPHYAINYVKYTFQHGFDSTFNELLHNFKCDMWSTCGVKYNIIDSQTIHSIIS